MKQYMKTSQQRSFPVSGFHKSAEHSVSPLVISQPSITGRDCVCEQGCQRCSTMSAEQAADAKAQAVLQNPSSSSANHQPIRPRPYSDSNLGSSMTMSAQERRFFEDRFHQDFSHIQIHQDHHAHHLTNQLGTKAFAYANHLYFNQGSYAPFSPEGQMIIAHELAHTNQQGQTGQPGIQCWAASVHQTITKSVINAYFSGQFSSDALANLAFYSGQLDQRGCNYLYYVQDFILPKVPIIGSIVQSPSIPILSLITGKLTDYEAPNHGEANVYKYAGTKTNQNINRMNEHLAKALSLVTKNGVTKEALVYWGMALHVGQDRGSHQEGSKGKGHDRKKDDQGRPWNCDDPKDNSAGYQIAQDHTKVLISKFLKALTPVQLQALKAATFGNLAGQPGPHVGTLPTPTNPAIPKDIVSRRLVYMTIMKRMIYGKDDMPKRLFGMLPLMTKVGLGISGQHHKQLSLEPQLGLRVTKPTPLSYLDVFTGPSVGLGLDRKKAAFGWALAAQLGLIGEQNDLNLMVNQSWTTSGSTTVVGLSGTFDEVKLIEKIFGK